MRTTFILFLIVFVNLVPHVAKADKLITKNWLSSGQDLYLIESSIRSAGELDVYAAVSYYKMNETKNYLEVFDGDFNVIGREFIGDYRSYAFLQIFDCNKNLEASYSIMYFSTDMPTKGKKIHDEILDLPFFIPDSQLLMDKVCEIGRSKNIGS
jgi:hypothetical protein